MKAYRHRDLSIIELDSGDTLVSACDSCGSVGEKPMDELKVPAEITGRYTVRVPLMEVLCTGAWVVSVSDSVCCEMEPTGRKIIEGITQELALAGVAPELLTGSTEENFPSHATGLGVVVLGVCQGKPNFEKACIGDVVVCVGLPKVGAEIDLRGDDEIANYQDIYTLLETEGVRELIPCGSKGIAYEAQQAAQYSNLCFVPFETTIDLNKTAGPATCFVAVLSADALWQAQSTIPHSKLNIIGRLLKQKAVTV